MTDPEQEPDPWIDPADFGPEGIDGWRPPGTEPTANGDDPTPGDPQLQAEPEDEPTA
jgi:hypothetical protein